MGKIRLSADIKVARKYEEEKTMRAFQIDPRLI